MRRCLARTHDLSRRGRDANGPGLLAETRSLVESGATVLGCASLDDGGRPRYSVSVASQLVACGMPVAAEDSDVVGLDCGVLCGRGGFVWIV